MASFKDYFSAHAEHYAAARPDYPAELFDWLASLTAQHEQAWDAGCGNGQASRVLAHHYQRVLATDASADQIARATPTPGVQFEAAPAERCSLAAGSCDLITVAQAAHWFDLDAFYAEVKRVARPAAVLAIWCYGLNRIDADIDAIVGRLYDGILKHDWPPERRLIDAAYRTLDFPWPGLSAPALEMTRHWSADEFLAYLRSWSAAQRYLKRRGQDAVALVEDALRKAWGGGRRTVAWPLHFRVARI